MKAILQHDMRDCGAACLAMIAKHYGISLTIAECRELTRTDRDGTNLYGLVDAGTALGFSADALSGSREELVKSINNGEIKTPFIAHIISEHVMLHFVVVKKCENGFFYINDPGKGKEKLSFDDFFDCWTGYIVTFEPTEKLKKVSRKSIGKKYIKLLSGQYLTLGMILLASVFISAIGIAGTFVFRIVIDGLTEAQPLYKVGGQSISKIFAALTALYAIMALVQFFRGKLVISFSKHIDAELTLLYFFHVMDLPVQSVSIRQTGEYLSRLSDISEIRTAISTVTITLLLDTMMVLGCGVVLFNENSRLFAISLIMIAVYAVIVFSYKKPIEKSNRSVMENNAILQSYFKESIDGVETSKAACAISAVKEKAHRLYFRFIHSVYKSNIITVSQDSLIDAVEMIGTVSILWVGFAMVGRSVITLGQLMTFYALLAYFTVPVKNLIGLQSTLQTAFVAVDRLNDILEMKTEEYDNPGSSFEELKEITFDNIDFRYGNRELTLKRISLSIKHGEKIAVVGESGSGKTTLAKLILRFYEPESGEIRINGVNAKDYNLTALRKKIAYVDQNSFLFSDTVKNNLKLSCAEATDEQIIEVCKMCRANDFIETLPFGYDTPLDENGMSLSGGQRQRLSIARAMLKKPKLLILDEATSNLDTITEAGIKNTVFSLDKELTCIIIAHRLSTIKNCDRIYVMEHGEIVESGTHRELLEKGGRYAELWTHQ